MLIEPLVIRDLALISHLQPSGWQDITPWTSYYVKSPFCYPLKLSFDGEMVGVGCGIIHGDVAWVAHIIVHPDHRNKGFGGMITKAVMDDVVSKGCKTLNLIATDLGAPVYTKLGFETEGEYVFFKELSPILDTPDPKIISYQSRFEKDVFALDKLASAEDRMVRLAPHLHDGFVHHEENRLTGFYLPTLGDGLIIASTESAGNALMKFRLATKDDACFPIENKVALSFMHALGYNARRLAKRMRFGTAILWKPEMLYGRIAGNLG